MTKEKVRGTEVTLQGKAEKEDEVTQEKVRGTEVRRGKIR